MAKKKAAGKQSKTSLGKKKGSSKKATKSKKKVSRKQSRLSDKKFPKDANVWVDIESYNDPVLNAGNLEILVYVTARGPKSKSFCDFDYQAEYIDSEGKWWKSSSVEPVTPPDNKVGVLKFILGKVRSGGGQTLEEEELVVTVLTTKSTKPNL